MNTNTTAEPEPLIKKFAKFVIEKRQALGMSQSDLAIEVYATEEYIKWRDYFAEREGQKLNEVELKYLKEHKEVRRKLSTRRGFIFEIETGVRTSLTFAVMEKILRVLNSEIEFKEHPNFY